MINRQTISLFILSFSILCYELLIIRVLSVIYEYDLLFIIISLSVLGLGIGGITYYKLSIINSCVKAWIESALFLFPLSFILSLWITIDHFDIITLPGSILIILIPLFIGGMLISSIFSKNTRKSATFYFFDLTGGAIGALLSIPFIHYLGGINSIIGVAVVASLPTLIIVRKKRAWIPIIVTSLILITNIAYSYINLGINQIKKTNTPLGQMLNYPGIKSEWLSSKWDIYSRIDLVKASRDDSRRSIFINGGTQAMMFRYDEDESNRERLSNFIGRSILLFPYLFDSNNTVLNIGSGGGMDVRVALLSGAKEVTAVEINKGIINVVKEENDYNGNIYWLDNVKLINEDGRTFIMRTEKKYDRIVLSLASTFAFSDINSMAQMENYLYTKEAFKEYITKLTDNGTLVIYIDYSELLEKFIFTAIDALTEEANITIEQAMGYITALETEYMSGYKYVLMVKKTPYSETTTNNIFTQMTNFNLSPVHVPRLEAGNDFDLIANGSLSPEEYIQNNSSNLKPSTDNLPFFLEVVFEHRIKMIILFMSVLLFMLLAIILFQSGLIRQIITSVNTAKYSYNPVTFILYFVCIGVGFMLVEIMLTKRFSFYLGYPHLNIAIILFTILIGTGLGSFLSGKITMEKIENFTGIASIGLIFALILFEFTNNLFIEKTIQYSLGTRAIMVVLYLLPTAMLLGFFFPSGMRMLADLSETEVAWFWGINGVASVTGSALSVVVAMSYGFSAVIYIAISLYAIVAFLLLGLSIYSSAISTQHSPLP